MMRLKSSRPPGQAALTGSRHVSSSPYAIGLVRRALLCLFLMSGGGVRAQEAQPANGTAANVREIKDGEVAASIERAMRGAQRRLRRPECARIFDHFSDGNGRPLSEVLSTLAMTPKEATARVIFRDGRENAMCRTAAAAFTGPGSRVVSSAGITSARSAASVPNSSSFTSCCTRSG